ncbi:methyltransferase [Actinomyces sp. B33]|uniref:THUMP-like domain-containing protein n=1 Tax=Actinomyces sp. B33 TaxID=2942131 RepID=UPI00233FAB25|nr:methyltransferase [Actinomyces sp. B33]MDC4233639.1 methyltransferase [Actinomyces sp. B33]
MPSCLEPILSSPGWELLQAWESRPERASTDPLALGRALRRSGVSPETAAAVLGQLALRDRAEAKFGDFARSMIFTRDGLEQATRLVVAALHARRYVDSGATRVADLGCGIGADAMAMAGLGLGVLAIDIDDEAAAAAAVNLRAFPDARVELGDATDLDPQDLTARGVDAIYADPARRTGAARGSTRLHDPESWSPPLSAVLAWSESIPRVGAKLAPGIDHSALPGDWRAEWTSVDSDLVEAAVWSPDLAPEGPGRTAVVIRSGRAHRLSDPDVRRADAPVPAAPVGPLGSVIAEPDAAVIRSGCVARLAADLGAHCVSERIAYLTGDDLPASPFVRRFEVVDAVALRPKAITAALRAMGAGRVEIKKRGADIDPAALRARLSLTGDADAVVIATRLEGRHRAIIAIRCDNRAR